jgi:hypothetical protein
MVRKIITWVDLQGRYRVTSPAYDSLARARGFDEDEAISWVWAKIVASGRYGIQANHPFHLVEDADQRIRLAECCGTYFRHGALMKPNREGERDAAGNIHLVRDARDGAWEMDTDGRPKVNMTKARGVHMDAIRVVRNAELAKLDVPFMRAMEASDTDAQATIATKKQVLRDIPQTLDLTTDTPEQLKALWPAELPARE